MFVRASNGHAVAKLALLQHGGLATAHNDNRLPWLGAT
jgi:hypothetical protein